MHPILFETPWFNVYSFGFMVALGYTAAIAIASYTAKKNGLSAGNIFDMMLFQLVVGILGCRLLFTLEYTPQRLNFSDFFSFEQGGMTFYGSVIAGFAFDLLYLKFMKMPFWKSMDCVGLSMGPGMAIARVGCFLNGCCFGTPCSEAIGFKFRFAGEGYYHATQLYESFLCLVAFAIVWQIKKRQNHHGELFLGYISIYGFFRFLLEFIRAENPIFMFGITLSQVIGLASIILSLVIWMFIKKDKSLQIMPSTEEQSLEGKK